MFRSVVALLAFRELYVSRLAQLRWKACGERHKMPNAATRLARGGSSRLTHLRWEACSDLFYTFFLKKTPRTPRKLLFKRVESFHEGV